MALLADIAAITTGYTFRSRVTDDRDGVVPVLQMRDMNPSGKVTASTLPRVSNDNKLGSRRLCTNDIVFRSRGDCNTATLVSAGLAGTVAASPLTVIRVDEAKASPAYVAWYLNQREAQRHLMASATGSTIRMIPMETLRSLVIPLPDKKTQNHIAAITELQARELYLESRLSELRSTLVGSQLTSIVNVLRTPPDTSR